MQQFDETELMRFADTVRRACVRAAQDGYDRARTDGVCIEGALESALSSLQSLDLGHIVRTFLHNTTT